MQILVLYYTRSGRTKTVAEEIVRGIQQVPGVTPVLKPVLETTKDDFLAADGIIAGSPVYFGGMAGEMKTVFDNTHTIRKKMENKIGAAFTTSHHHTGGKETTLFSIIQYFLISGMIVMGDSIERGGHYGVACDKTYDENIAEDARHLGQRVASFTRKFGK